MALVFRGRCNRVDVTKEKGTNFKGHKEVCNQQAAEEVEIKNLLYQYEQGQIDQLPVVRPAQYNDVLLTPQSYEQAKELINSVEYDFYSLPVEEQRKFGNIQTYVADICKMANGDVNTINKYKVNVSPLNTSVDGTIQGAAGTTSSSISRSDSGISSETVKSSPVVDSAVSKE